MLVEWLCSGLDTMRKQGDCERVPITASWGCPNRGPQPGLMLMSSDSLCPTGDLIMSTRQLMEARGCHPLLTLQIYVLSIRPSPTIETKWQQELGTEEGSFGHLSLLTLLWACAVPPRPWPQVPQEPSGNECPPLPQDRTFPCHPGIPGTAAVLAAAC